MGRMEKMGKNEERYTRGICVVWSAGLEVTRSKWWNWEARDGMSVREIWSVAGEETGKSLQSLLARDGEKHHKRRAGQEAQSKDQVKNGPDMNLLMCIRQV